MEDRPFCSWVNWRGLPEADNKVQVHRNTPHGTQYLFKEPCFCFRYPHEGRGEERNSEGLFNHFDLQQFKWFCTFLGGLKMQMLAKTTLLVHIQTSRHVLARLPWYLVWIFMAPKGHLLMIMEMPWPPLWYDHACQNFHLYTKKCHSLRGKSDCSSKPAFLCCLACATLHKTSHNLISRYLLNAAVFAKCWPSAYDDPMTFTAVGQWMYAVYYRLYESWIMVNVPFVFLGCFCEY